MSQENGREIDLNVMVQIREGGVSDMEGRKRGPKLQGVGKCSVGGHGVRENDHFDFIPIIESVMMEQKGRK